MRTVKVLMNHNPKQLLGMILVPEDLETLLGEGWVELDPAWQVEPDGTIKLVEVSIVLKEDRG